MIGISKSETLKNKHVISMKVKIFFLTGSEIRGPQNSDPYPWTKIWTRPRPSVLNRRWTSLKSKTRFFVCSVLQKFSIRTTFWFWSFESWIFFIKVVRGSGTFVTICNVIGSPTWNWVRSDPSLSKSFKWIILRCHELVTESPFLWQLQIDVTRLQ